MGDHADRHRDKGARERDLERGRKIENVECLNQAFRHATIPAHAALKANASGHNLNRRVMSFGFNEKTLDFHIGKQWKFLSNPLASRDRPPGGWVVDDSGDAVELLFVAVHGLMLNRRQRLSSTRLHSAAVDPLRTATFLQSGRSNAATVCQGTTS
ncbi:hypothetical protein [Paraburkholderia sp. HP33-1]|uniref:hypothetical protein n=1 Tax=Paraburkholderia sp. HP33-1 TaxID=2883243 RepID=UPI001F3B030B|nr:hypothetical protein [Paraburkholderia sp. HP33-1]